MEDVVIPIVGMMIPILALSIPIVAILTQHQRKMAEIFNRQGAAQRQGDALVTEQINALRAEIKELRELVHQQVLALDEPRPIRADLGSVPPTVEPFAGEQIRTVQGGP